MLKSILKVRDTVCDLLARAADQALILDLLLPLVSAATLPEHPSMSVAYTSPILTNMAQNACEMAQRERKTLANAKRLMTKLRGDETWLPCELFYSERDEAMFNTEKLYNGAPIHSLPRTVNGFNTQTLLDGRTRAESRSVSRKSSVSGTELGSCNAETKELHKGSTTEYRFGTEKTHGEAPLEGSMDEGSREVIATEAQQEGDVDMGDARSETPPKDPETTEKVIQDEVVNIVGAEISITGEPQPDDPIQQDTGASYIESEKANGAASRSSAQENTGVENDHGTVSATENTSSHHLPTPDPEEPGNEDSEGNEGHGTSQIAPRRMRTRAQAQAASEPTVSTRNESPESWVPPEIHPLFKIPETAIPDKDIGLPKAEADETRRLFTMYVQKQEEVCRGAERLYDGLLQADRQRKMVLKWCKAEGHVGEMSDGEDWYDKEEWGLEEELEKGHNDEDGDTNAIIQGKKTRGRRT